MKLRCLEGCTATSSSSSYSILPSISEYEKQDDHQNEKQECMRFYNDDGSYQEVVIEERLRAGDLCLLLAVRNRVAKSPHWTIFEQWDKYGLERIVEDHEEILQVYKQTTCTSKKYIFRKYSSKYDFPTHTQGECVKNIDFTTIWDNERDLYQSPIINQCINHQSHLHPHRTRSPSPDIFSAPEKSCGLAEFTRFWYMDPHKTYISWLPTFLFLRGRHIYMSSKIDVVAKFVRHLSHKKKYSELDESEQNVIVGSGELDCVEPIADLSKVDIYRVLNAKRHLSSPTEFGVTLRHSSSQDFTDSICLSAYTSSDLEQWLAAMRLAKYGAQLRDNYRSFKNKQGQSSPRDYNKHSVPNESVRSRVAMDFTGSVGRIVEDPNEAKAIALAESLVYKKRYRSSQLNRLGQESGGQTGQSCDIELLKSIPWFHKSLSRQEANNLLSNSNNQDGVFLVRESRSNTGSFVLTFKCSNKVIHMPITPMQDIVRDTLCYTLDNGVTKFYDILQLVEFYQLNAGCLPTRLTSYICLQS